MTDPDKLAKHKRGRLVDWPGLRALYLSGAVTLREIAQQTGIPETAIRARAYRQKWTDEARRAQAAREAARMEELERIAAESAQNRTAELDRIIEGAETHRIEEAKLLFATNKVELKPIEKNNAEKILDGEISLKTGALAIPSKNFENLSSLREIYQGRMVVMAIRVAEHVATMDTNELIHRADKIAALDKMSRIHLGIEDKTERNVAAVNLTLMTSPGDFQTVKTEAQPVDVS